MNFTINQLSQDVLDNMHKLEGLSIGSIAAYINARAGRVASLNPTGLDIINQFNLIESELLEGKFAALRGDLAQVRDAIADIILLAAGQQGIIKGINVDADYERMCAFNMTRIPQTFDEAADTVEKYKKINIDCMIHEIDVDTPFGKVKLFPVRTLDYEQVSTNNEHFAANKFLKSVNFSDVFYDKPDVDIAISNPCEVEYQTKAAKMVGQRFTKEHNSMVQELAEKHGLTYFDGYAMFAEELSKLVGERF